jgi:hypothetical protein
MWAQQCQKYSPIPPHAEKYGKKFGNVLFPLQSPLVTFMNFFHFDHVQFGRGIIHQLNTAGGSVSAVLDPEKPARHIGPKVGSIEIREGDWNAYMHFIARCSEDKSLAERYGNVVAYKRACALAYLGRRAQLHGGVCSTRHPHIMTAQFIAELEANNRTARHVRYPWLLALMKLLAEIEQIQDQVAGSNVISLVPPPK